MPYDFTKPWFYLRRDFADELGFGDYLLLKVGSKAIDEVRCQRNAELGLSPGMPRFVAYFILGTNACITEDLRNYYMIPMNGLFEDLLSRLAASVNRSALLHGATITSSPPASINATKSGRPDYVVVHDTHTGGAYLWPADAETERFLREHR